MPTTGSENPMQSWFATNTGMSKSDSEAAFQEILRRIPSASEGLGSIQEYQLLNSGHGGASMQRVASLELLRSLVSANGGNDTWVSPGKDVSPRTGPEGLQGAMQATERDVARPFIAQQAPAIPVPPAMPAPALTSVQRPLFERPVARVQTGFPTASSPEQPPFEPRRGVSTASEGPSVGGDGASDALDKAEFRRQRRMLSNRESARRSRRRKQEHLQKMEDELRRAHDERDAANKRVEQLQKQLDAKRMKCEELESENARLVQHLQALGALPQKRPAPGLEQADARAKKARRSKQSTPEVQQDDGTVQV